MNTAAFQLDLAHEINLCLQLLAATNSIARYMVDDIGLNYHALILYIA